MYQNRRITILFIFLYTLICYGKNLPDLVTYRNEVYITIDKAQSIIKIKFKAYNIGTADMPQTHIYISMYTVLSGGGITYPMPVYNDTLVPFTVDMKRWSFHFPMRVGQLH